MFEGNLTENGFEEVAKSGGLKPLDWPALMARLAAARELRGALAANRESAKGNFACFSKSAPAEARTNVQSDKCVNENGVRVNPDDLADGKSCDGNVPDIAVDPQPGDRE